MSAIVLTSGVAKSFPINPNSPGGVKPLYSIQMGANQHHLHVVVTGLGSNSPTYCSGYVRWKNGVAPDGEYPGHTGCDGKLYGAGSADITVPAGSIEYFEVDVTTLIYSSGTTVANGTITVTATA